MGILRGSKTQRWLASLYILVIGVIATAGFTAESTATILLAALLSLPASVLAVPGYYVAYGLLAQVPGANPSHSSGSFSCTADGQCTGSSTGDLASWFQVTTDVVGILALSCAALLNVLAFQAMTRRRLSR